MSTTAFDALSNYIQHTTECSPALRDAYAHAEEYSLTVPDFPTGQLLSTLAAASTGHRGQTEKAQVVAATPAVSVAGLYLLEGLGQSGSLTCIDPEAEHQNHARELFRSAGYSTSRVRFLPSRPLDVMSRLANDAYQVIYADVAAPDLKATVEAAWPLLAPHGTLVLAGSLLDGTVADNTRTDRDTASAREADAVVRELAQADSGAAAQATVTRLPLGAGVTLVTKR